MSISYSNSPCNYLLIAGERGRLLQVPPKPQPLLPPLPRGLTIMTVFDYLSQSAADTDKENLCV